MARANRTRTRRRERKFVPRGKAFIMSTFNNTLVSLTDPEGNVIGVGDVKTQTVETLKNLVAVLAAGGASVEDVVKTTVFLPDLRHYASMNEAYAKFFPKDPPARSTILAPLALPELLVEVEAVAVLGD